jgi:hypothetical protein
MPHVLVWDLETMPDLRGFAAANDLDGKSPPKPKPDDEQHESRNARERRIKIARLRRAGRLPLTVSKDGLRELRRRQWRKRRHDRDSHRGLVFEKKKSAHA